MMVVGEQSLAIQAQDVVEQVVAEEPVLVVLYPPPYSPLLTKERGRG